METGRDAVELLSPAGDFETALAAFDAGADAVYCGMKDFSARAFAKNLSPGELDSLMRAAAARGKKVYVALNTLVEESDLPSALRLLGEIDAIHPDGVILQDLGLARAAHRSFPRLALHASTQLFAHNTESVLGLRDIGFTTVVLARELSLDEITSIRKHCSGVRLECFVHGALCYSVSGLCLFSAMEKGRSGNSGRCAYCCRSGVSGDGRQYMFSMKDLRLSEDALRLKDAGVDSLKIEGRMKSSLYVASATAYYRRILDTGRAPSAQETSDLETVFSRGTTKLYLDGKAESVIDPGNLGHLGARIGTIKRVTRDTRSLEWLRFRTDRALERHDGIQIVSESGGRPFGFGITKIRKAISRANVYETAAGEDVELLLPEKRDVEIRPGDGVYCSMSNAVKRKFPQPSFRPSECPARDVADVAVSISPGFVSAVISSTGISASAEVSGTFAPAKNPELALSAAEKAFSRMGDSRWRLGSVRLNDAARLFVPPAAMNELRRKAVSSLEKEWNQAKDLRIEEALESAAREAARMKDGAAGMDVPQKTVKIRLGQELPSGEWDEIIVAVSPFSKPGDLSPEIRQEAEKGRIRLAAPVWIGESDVQKFRVSAKGFLRAGYSKWEAADLSALRILRGAGVLDISADWSLYACNSQSLSQLASMGIARFTASPESSPANLRFMSESGCRMEFLRQQHTPLFISKTRPDGAFPDESPFSVFRNGGLWITVRRTPRIFDVPEGVPQRIDLSWSPE